MVAISAHPDAALMYMELYMKTYMETYVEAYLEACMDSASERMDMPQMEKRITSGAVSSQDDGLQDLKEIGCPGNKVFLTSDANRKSAKNRFLESNPAFRDVAVVVLADESDEFLVVMDEIRSPKLNPGAPATWEDDDSKSP
jgi:hypothetical protein